MEGTRTTNPQQIDGVVRIAGEAKVKAIDEDMVYEAYTKTKDAVGGMDGWEAKELALFSRGICRWVAEFYTLI